MQSTVPSHGSEASATQKVAPAAHNAMPDTRLTMFGVFIGGGRTACCQWHFGSIYNPASPPPPHLHPRTTGPVARDTRKQMLKDSLPPESLAVKDAAGDKGKGEGGVGKIHR